MIRGRYDDPYRYGATGMEALRVSIWAFPYTMCANCYKYTKILYERDNGPGSALDALTMPIPEDWLQ